MALGTYPSDTYYRSWITQRMLNNMPEWAHARTCGVSVGHQVLNYGASLVEETTQQLVEERSNLFLSSCDPTLMNKLYKAELPFGFFFQQEPHGDDRTIYVVPKVYAMINGTEQQISQAEQNDIRSLYYTALPTRVEYGNVQILWNDIIPDTAASDILALEPEAMPIEGHLYITIRGNTIWEREFRNQLYFSKISINGTTRKGTVQTEVVPLRLNGTVKTINQWKSVSEIFVSHLADDAQLTMSALPFVETEPVDQMNLAVPVEGGDRSQFVSLGTKSFGSTVVAKSYINEDLDFVRKGIEDKRTDYELELLDENGNNVSLNGFMMKPNTQLIYGIDDYYLYVYDRRVPYPDVSGMIGESPDCRIELTVSDFQWMQTRGSTITVHTRTIDVLAIPLVVRWAVTVPDGSKYRVGLDGSYWPENTEGWVTNEFSDQGRWREQNIDFVLDQTGEYIIEFEARYEEDAEIIYRTAKLMLYVPAIQPQVQLVLPSSLRGCRDLAMDSNGDLWFYNGTSIFKVNLFHDYFAVDYETKDIWLREQYNEIRMVP